MKEDIEELKKYNPEYSFIVAGDLNSEIKEDLKIKTLQSGGKSSLVKVYVFPPPKSEQHITCNKKRSLMQPQRHKAEKLDQGTKDYIVTDLEINSSRIMMINGE